MTKPTADIVVAALTTRFEHCPPTLVPQLTTALVRLLMEGAKYEGFWSGEIVPPFEDESGNWRLVQRFRTPAQASAWSAAEARKQLIGQFPRSDNGSSLNVTESIIEKDQSGVATAIVTDVKPGMEEDYFAWEEKIQLAQARHPGYRGVYLQPPAPGRQGQWATLLRFESPDALTNWFDSAERQSLLNESQKFVKATHFRPISNSFPGWVPLDSSTGQPPPNWKTALLVLLGLFPVVMLEIRFVAPLLKELNSSVSSFISLVGSVLGTTWGTMPLFIRAFGWWLFPKEGAAQKVNLVGTAAVALLLLFEILALWNLLPPKH